MSLSVFLKEHKNKEKVSFHMPGHKGRRIFDMHGMKEEIDSLVDGDVTEIPGADNLFIHDGVIKEIMDGYKRIYHSCETFLSVGGSSAGILAAILATVSRDAEVIVPRNCHRAVFNAISLAGAKPHMVYPEIIDEFNIAGEVKASKIADALDEECEGQARRVVVITSPNYYGITCDVNAVAREVHARGGILILDQAHGAHLMSLYPKLSGDMSEERPDIVIESTHKTMASFTQTAIVNIYNESLVDLVEKKLRIVESTSPSYILMKSLELNVRLVEEFGEKLFLSWRDDLDFFYGKAKEIPGLRLLDIPTKDRSKIVIDAESIGLAAEALDCALMERGIFSEFTSGNLLVCMSGIGNVRGDYELLLDALENACEDAETIMEKYAYLADRSVITDRYGEERRLAEGESCPLPAPGEIITVWS